MIEFIYSYLLKLTLKSILPPLLIAFFSTVLSFFIGALPTAYILSRYKKGIDITQYGSGNSGATNAARLLGVHYFFIVFFIDFLKAFLFMSLMFYTTSFPLSFYCFLSMLFLIGNHFSPFLHFKGGKGVSSVVGILAALFPAPVCISFLGLWITIFYKTRTSYKASLSAMLITGFGYLIVYSPPALTLKPLILFIIMWLFFTHRNNLQNPLHSSAY